MDRGIDYFFDDWSPSSAEEHAVFDAHEGSVSWNSLSLPFNQAMLNVSDSQILCEQLLPFAVSETAPQISECEMEDLDLLACQDLGHDDGYTQDTLLKQLQTSSWHRPELIKDYAFFVKEKPDTHIGPELCNERALPFNKFPICGKIKKENNPLHYPLDTISRECETSERVQSNIQPNTSTIDIKFSHNVSHSQLHQFAEQVQDKFQALNNSSTWDKRDYEKQDVSGKETSAMYSSTFPKCLLPNDWISLTHDTFTCYSDPVFSLNFDSNMTESLCINDTDCWNETSIGTVPESSDDFSSNICDLFILNSGPAVSCGRNTKESFFSADSLLAQNITTHCTAAESEYQSSSVPRKTEESIFIPNSYSCECTSTPFVAAKNETASLSVTQIQTESLILPQSMTMNSFANEDKDFGFPVFYSPSLSQLQAREENQMHAQIVLPDYRKRQIISKDSPSSVVLAVEDLRQSAETDIPQTYIESYHTSLVEDQRHLFFSSKTDKLQTATGKDCNFSESWRPLKCSTEETFKISKRVTSDVSDKISPTGNENCIMAMTSELSCSAPKSLATAAARKKTSAFRVGKKDRFITLPAKSLNKFMVSDLLSLSGNGEKIGTKERTNEYRKDMRMIKQQKKKRLKQVSMCG